MKGKEMEGVWRESALCLFRREGKKREKEEYECCPSKSFHFNGMLGLGVNI